VSVLKKEFMHGGEMCVKVSVSGSASEIDAACQAIAAADVEILDQDGQSGASEHKSQPTIQAAGPGGDLKSRRPAARPEVKKPVAAARPEIKKPAAAVRGESGGEASSELESSDVSSDEDE
jgi:hypothetical protein